MLLTGQSDGGACPHKVHKHRVAVQRQTGQCSTGAGSGFFRGLVRALQIGGTAPVVNKPGGREEYAAAGNFGLEPDSVRPLPLILNKCGPVTRPTKPAAQQAQNQGNRS
ncbi:hypothetical protein ACFQT0_31215 [Hymenobacter humi]|uniref:Uncharacterized protein n=1 Tax=Hymenobacter humi TaxID=1411620 RepID=A0ABW2UH08_9BACT